MDIEKVTEFRKRKLSITASDATAVKLSADEADAKTEGEKQALKLAKILKLRTRTQQEPFNGVPFVTFIVKGKLNRVRSVSICAADNCTTPRWRTPDGNWREDSILAHVQQCHADIATVVNKKIKAEPSASTGVKIETSTAHSQSEKAQAIASQQSTESKGAS